VWPVTCLLLLLSRTHIFVPMHAYVHTQMKTTTRTVEDHAHSAGVKEKEVDERDTLLEKLQVLGIAVGCPVFVRACKSGCRI